MTRLNFESGLFVPISTAILLGLLLRIVFTLTTPVGGTSEARQLSSYNDELAHANYILTLITTRSLPGNDEPIDKPGALERGNFENYQPPLYYLTVAGIAQLSGFRSLDQITRLGRYLGLVFFAGLVVIYGLITSVFRFGEVSFSIGLVILSLNGSFVRFTSTTGNDPMFWVLAGGMIWACLRLWRDGLSAKWLAVFAVFSILGLYTKLTTLVLLPLPLLAVIRERKSGGWGQMFATYMVIVSASLPVWQRNLSDFGSLFPLATGFGTTELHLPGISFVFYAFRSLVFPWSEFWFGWLGLILLAIPAVVLCYWIVIGKGIKYVLNPVLATAGLLSVLSFIWLNILYEQAEGRYLLSSWPVWCLFCSVVPKSPYMVWLTIVALLCPYLLFLFPLIGA